MATLPPPSFPFGVPPPPPPTRWPFATPTPPPSPRDSWWWPRVTPPSPSETNRALAGGIVVAVIVAMSVAMIVAVLVCSLLQRHRSIRAAAAAARHVRPPPPHQQAGARYGTDEEEEEEELHLRRCSAASASTAASPRLPAFTYSQSVKVNVTGAGAEETATCSVCLGAFQLGEAVRLLPACLHLYHAECIDPWLDAHTTCPLCRSDTDPTADDGRPPPV